MSLLQVIEEMCRNLCCRVGQRNNGKWFFWPWGFEHEVAAVIPPEDITPITYHIEDKTSVINRVKIAYARSVRNLNLERGAQQGEFSNYESTLEWDADTNTKTALLSAVSEALYGRRELEFNACNFLATEREAETFAEYHMARFDKPSTYVNFIVPYEPYENLELLQVIKAAHPAWPAFYGTNPSDKEPIWEDPSDPADTGPSDLKQGFYWTRAKTYRMQIEGRFRRPGVGEPSSLRLVCRLLLNYPNDPT